MRGTAALERLRAQPDSSAVLLDFDGTLSPIVPVASEARLAEGAHEVLSALAGRYGRVALVSGRPVAFLAAQAPEAVDLVGLYGLEHRLGGALGTHPEAPPWRDVVRELAEAAAAALPGVDVEDKGFSLTLHHRHHPEMAGPSTSWALQHGEATGMHVRAAKASVELHPPIAVDKGDVVGMLAAGSAGVLWAGDDLGDLPAFAALRRLRADSFAVAVGGPELPEAVRVAADLVLGSPDDLVALLRTLLEPG